MKKKIFVIGLIFSFVLLSFATRASDKKNSEIIIFQVKIAADQDYQIKENWQDDLRNLMEIANQELERQKIKVKFEIVEIVSWQTKKEKIRNSDEALDDIVGKISLDKCDLIIAISEEVFSDEKQFGGCYFSYGKIDCILIKNYLEPIGKNPNKTWTLWILLHEFGHFLGLDHSDSPESIMHGKWLSRDSEFLEKEIEFINENALRVRNKKSSPY